MNTTDDKLLNSKEAAHMLTISPKTLESWRRCKGASKIPFTRIGGAIRYYLNDIKEYIKKGKVES